MICILIRRCWTSAGWPKRQETLQLAPGMPPLHTSRLAWNNAGAPEGQPAIFQLVTRISEARDLPKVTVGNSFRDAEPGAFELYPSPSAPWSPMSS